jgi:hypothetical protein
MGLLSFLLGREHVYFNLVDSTQVNFGGAKASPNTMFAKA